ncbi:MAG: glycosyltransferase family 4 protein [Candidatus Erginobacter occultus]|nr:glycosyltransferase family 4 protein [Candidatus Erginobacter occultus]
MILIVTRYFPPSRGGTEAYTFDLARGLAGQGREVVVLAPAAEGDRAFDEACGFEVIRCPSGRGRWGRLRELFRAARELQARRSIELVIATTWSPAGLIARFLRLSSSLPYLVVAHGSELYAHRPWNRLRGMVLAGAERVVANSEFTRRRLLMIGIKPEKIVVVPPAVNLEKLAAGGDRGLELPRGEDPLLLTVTRLAPKKGVDTVMSALPLVRERFGPIRYLVVGEGEDRCRLERLAGEIGVAESVTFAGRVSDEELAAAYRRSDLFLLVSREERGGSDYEGFGIVLLEAAAAGKPVIAGRSGGIPEAVADGESGLLVDPSSPEETAEAVVSLLKDPKRARRMGEAGKRRVEESFSVEAMADRLEPILGERGR